MADQKISQLSSGAPAQAGDEYVVARSGANYKLTLTNIAASMPPIGATTPNTGAFTSLTNGLGAVGTPSYTFTGDLNTGMWSPTADTIAWSTGGSERMRIDSSGNVGIGGTAQPQDRVGIEGALPTSSGSSTGFAVRGTIPSGSTAGTNVFISRVTTSAASFTTGEFRHFYANPATKGAGSTITNQYGFLAESTLTDATNNYGFFGNIASGANRWNFYAAGTAQNYFAGRVGVGTTAPTYLLEVTATGSARTNVPARFGNAAGNLDIGGSDGGYVYIDSRQWGLGLRTGTGTGQAYFTTAGEFIIGQTDQGAYNLQCNGTGVWGAGAYVNGSDARLKDNIQSLDSGLDVVKAMRPVTFQYKPEYNKDQSVQPGFIAQELQTAMAGKAYLEGVVQEGPNHLNVAYQNIIPILVKAIQELEAKVAALEAK